MNQDNHRINEETYSEGEILSPTNQQPNENINFCGKDLNITKSQLITLVLLCSNFLISSACYSLLAPFFPLVALQKEISKTQVGIIFGVFELVLLVLSPIFGKYVNESNFLTLNPYSLFFSIRFKCLEFDSFL